MERHRVCWLPCRKFPHGVPRVLGTPKVSGQLDHICWSPDDRRLPFTLISAGAGALLPLLELLISNWPMSRRPTLQGSQMGPWRGTDSATVTAEAYSGAD